MATETGIIMLVYLREAIEKRGGLEKIKSLEELRQAVIEGAVHRLRPKLLTEGVATIAIFPIVFAKGVGVRFLRQWPFRCSVDCSSQMKWSICFFPYASIGSGELVG